MPICPICKRDVKRVLSCEHTNDEDVCVECYQEIHYKITKRG